MYENMSKSVMNLSVLLFEEHLSILASARKFLSLKVILTPPQ